MRKPKVCPECTGFHRGTGNLLQLRGCLMLPEQHKQTTEKGNLLKGGERQGDEKSTALTPLAKIVLQLLNAL